MRFIKRSPIVAWLTTLSLLLTLSTGILVGEKAHAQSINVLQKHNKISSDLSEQVRRAQMNDDHLVRVILQLKAQPSAMLKAFFLNRQGMKMLARFDYFNSIAVELPASVVEFLASFPEIVSISLDAEVKPMGHVSLTTGADAARMLGNPAPSPAPSSSPGNLTPSISGNPTPNTLDGTGIGIAVLDSGLYSDHVSFLDRGSNQRAIFSQDFTGEGRTDDPYGHGSHVASIAAGNGRVSHAAYIGIAPNANIINLRVLNSQGSGSVSNVLSALNWVMANHSTYNIRVVNMSLGMPAVQSYTTDPICQAVRKLVDAGIVVAVAAGNNGKDSNGNKIYGGISSPGNEPSAITVGASNTYGTDARNDDTVTTYSSRGPTRSYSTDALGVKHYDNLLKPDLVAPGNKLVYVEAQNNLLVTEYPQLDAGVSPVTNRKMMYLNGTSMATPVVAGAAALLLQANPNLTPNLIKMILMYTAQPLAGANRFEQGTGEINIEGAVRLAQAIRTDLSSSTPVGAPLLTTSAPTPQTTIAGYTFTWSQGIFLNTTYATGLDLITKYQGIYGTGVLLSDGVVLSNGVILADASMMSGGVIVSDGVVVSDGTLLSDGVVVSDGVIVADGVLVADGVVVSDLILQAQSATVGGDNTSAMSSVADTGVDYLDY